MRHIVARLAVYGALLLASAAILPRLACAQDDPKAQAQKAGEQWLALVDTAKYGESWDDAGASFKAAASRTDWIKKAAAARKSMGRLTSRKLTKSDLVKDPPNSPPGSYVGLQYHSSFQNLKSAAETVVLTLDSNGKWKMSDYIVNKGS